MTPPMGEQMPREAAMHSHTAASAERFTVDRPAKEFIADPLVEGLDQPQLEATAGRRRFAVLRAAHRAARRSLRAVRRWPTPPAPSPYVATVIGGLALVLLAALGSTRIATTGDARVAAGAPIDVVLDGATVVTAQAAQEERAAGSTAAVSDGAPASVALDPALPEAAAVAASAAPAPAGASTAEASTATFTVISRWTVASGDSLISIAAAFDTTVEAILEENGLADQNQIMIGVALDVPLTLRLAPGLGATDGEGGPALVSWTVGPGDSLIALARDFGTTPVALAAVNALLDDALYIGQVLQIPEGWR